jgi:hypothetical protein
MMQVENPSEKIQVTNLFRSVTYTSVDDIIKMYYNEMAYEDADWICLTQDTV